MNCRWRHVFLADDAGDGEAIGAAFAFQLQDAVGKRAAQYAHMKPAIAHIEQQVPMVAAAHRLHLQDASFPQMMVDVGQFSTVYASKEGGHRVGLRNGDGRTDVGHLAQRAVKKHDGRI